MQQTADIDILYYSLRWYNVGDSSRFNLRRKVISDGKFHTVTVIYKKRNLFAENTVSLDTQKALVKSFVWSVALYESETWNALKVKKAKTGTFDV